MLAQIGTCKQRGHVTDLQACSQHGEFKKRPQWALPIIGGTGKNDNESHCTGRDKNPNFKKPPEDRPKQQNTDCKDGHATLPLINCDYGRNIYSLLPYIKRHEKNIVKSFFDHNGSG